MQEKFLGSSLDLLHILTGALVGFIIGLTGVGGGSLMTPILILGFQINPAIAVGTDLLYAALTKSNGMYFHARQKTIDWKVVCYLGMGSIPSSLVTILLISRLKAADYDYESLMTSVLGYMLVLTSFVVFSRNKLLRYLQRGLQNPNSVIYQLRNMRGGITWLAGIALGFLVTMSSVGAGAIGTALLFLLYPYKTTVQIVGTDLAHAVPLTAIAGIGHWKIGTVDFVLLVSLIGGGLPAIFFGSLLGKRIPDRLLRPLVASILLILGIRFSLQDWVCYNCLLQLFNF